MGGGDDLGDDDQYLNVTTLDSDDEEQSSSKKRKHDDDEVGDNDKAEKKKKKKKSKQLFRYVAVQSCEEQASYLWECYSDALTGKLKRSDKRLPLDQIGPKFTEKSIVKFEADDDHNDDRNIAPNFKSVLSMKRLKKWKTKKSPMIIIICVSARRAMSVLKGLAPLKCRCAKLFSKHMSVEDQRSMLENGTYGVAAGTPNRLLKLCSEGALDLSSTELVVLDGQEIHKTMNVCTLYDTAPDTMEFIMTYVQPGLTKGDTKLCMY